MQKFITKTVSVFTSIATLASLSGLAMLAPVATHAAVPSDYGLKEGNTISASGTNDPDVYIVNAQGYKRLFLNPVIFSFYGHLGGFAAVKSVSAAARDAFPTSGLFRDCEVGSVNNNGNVYAVEVNGEDTAVLHHVAMTGDQAVAQDSQFFNKVFCINDNEFNWYTKSSVDYTSLSQVPVYTRTPGSTPTNSPATSLSAGLASDNPASGSVVSSAAAVDLVHLQVNGSGSVTQVVLKRIGVSADASLSNVYLFNGNTRISDAATVTSGTITFNNASGLFTAPANISVRADLAASAGETLGVQLLSMNGIAMNVTGNLFTVATATLAGLTVGANTATSAPSSANAPGYTLWSAPFNTTTRDTYLKHVGFKQVGSMPFDAIQNYKLFLDGVQLGAGSMSADGSLVSFDMGSVGYLLRSGNHTLEMRGDIVKGSNRTYSFSISNKADVVLSDSQYGANIAATSGIPSTATTLTIPAGSVSVTTDTSFNSTNYVAGVNNVTLARYTFNGYGEDVKISQLAVGLTASASLANVTLWSSGTQISSAKNWTGSDLTFDLGSSLVIPAGTAKTVEVHADTKQASGANENANALLATLKGVSSNAQGVASSTVNTYPSTSGVAGPSLTLSTGGLTAALDSSLASHIESPNQNAVKVGSIVVQAANAEPIRISNVAVALTNTGANLNKYANLYISDNTVPVLPQATNNFSVNLTLQPNQSHTFSVYMDAGNVASAGNNSTLQTTLTITANGVNTGTAFNVNGQAGQTITFSLATMATTTLSANSLPAQYVLAGSQVTNALFHMSMSAGAGSAVVTDLHFSMTGSNSGSATLGTNTISSIMVGGKSASVISGKASVSGLALTVPAGFSGVDVPVTVTYNTVGFGGSSHAGDTSIMTLDEIKYTVGNTVKTSPVTSQAASTMTLVAAYPTVSIAKSDQNVSAGQVKIATLTISAPTSGDIKLRTLPLTLSTNGGTTASSSGTTAGTAVLVKNGNTTITTTTGAVFSLGTSASGTITVTFTNGYTISAGTSKTLDIYFSVLGGTLGNSGTSSLTTKLGTASGFVFDDVNGGAPGLSQTGTNIYSYPTNTATITN